MADKDALDIPFLCDLVDDADSVLFHIIDFYEPLQLAIVRHCVGINHHLWPFACINELTHIVTYHVAVEHAGLDTVAVIGKAIVVVPRLHVSDDVVFGLVLTDRSHLFIISDHLPHFFLREAEHLVEASIKAHIQCNIVATGEVVEGDG